MKAVNTGSADNDLDYTLSTCRALSPARQTFHGKLTIVFIFTLLLFFLSGLASPAQATTAPTIDPSYEVFSTSPQAVTITADMGDSIYYTTDGSDPDTGSTSYSSPFNVSVTTTVKAVAYDGVNLSAITTSIVQIDSTTANLPTSGLLCWLKADNGVITSSGSVTTWIDVSGNNNDATQSNSSNRPGVNSSAVAGLPAVTFNGSSQSLDLPSGFSDFTSGMSIFIVAKPTSAGSNNTILDLLAGSGSFNGRIVLWEPTTSQLRLELRNSSASVSDLNGTYQLGSYQLMEVIDDGSTTATMYIDSIQNAQNTSMYAIPNTTRATNVIGRYGYGSAFYAGEIAEILIYNEELNSTERAYVEEYLSQRYALPIPAPSISPENAVLASGPQSVTISHPMSAADIYYTTNGTTPTSGSTLYTGPFNISETATIKAIAVLGSSTSDVDTSYIQIDPSTAGVSRSGLLCWLKGDNGVISSGGTVSAWLDGSGNGNNATQTNSSNQPGLTASSIGGLPTITFNGSNQSFNLASGFSDFTNGMTMFVVANPIAAGDNNTIIDLLAGASNLNGRIVLWEPTTSQLRLELRSAAGAVSSLNGIFQMGNFQLMEAVYDGSTSATMLSNSVEEAESSSMSVVPDIARNGNVIGRYGYGSSYFNGEISEILIYNRDLDDDERSAVEQYLNNRYQLAQYAPSMSPSNGVFDESTNVTLATQPWANIRYTLDGSTPTTSSNLYLGSLPISKSAQIKAVAVQPFGVSEITTGVVQIDSTTSLVPRDNLALWLKSDYQVAASGGKVSNWMDASGNGNDASQATSSNQPALKVNAINGLPTVTFDGSTKFLQMGSGFADFTSGASAFIVAKPVSPVTSDGTLFDLGNAGSNDLALREPSSTGLELFSYSGGTPSSISASSAITVDQFQLMEAIHTGSDLTGRLLTDGSKTAFGPLTQLVNTTRSNNFIGQWNDGSGRFNGEIAEILLFSREVTAAERADIEAYLCDRYHLSVPPPLISPGSGVYDQSQSITITAPTKSQVFFTTDGTEPTEASTLYQGAFSLESSKNIKAIASAPWGDSPITSSFVQLDGNSDQVARDGLVLWLKADFGPELSGSNVINWGDLSGNDNNASQSNGSSQPIFTPGSSGTNPSISFNGSSQFLQIPSLYSSFSSGATGFLVAKPSSLSSGATFFDFGNGSTSNNLSLAQADGSGTMRLHVFSGSSDSSIDGAGALEAGKIRLQEFVHDGAGSASLLTNSSEVGQGSINNIASIIRTGNFIGQQTGGTNFLPGEISELILFNRPLSSAEQAGVEAYLTHKYQLLTIVPSSPIISVPTGTLDEPTQVSISSPSDTAVYFTVDGTTPTSSSTLYTGPINIAFTQTLKAISIKAGVSSSVATATYTLNSTDWPAPDAGDLTPLDIKLRLPSTSIPE